MPGAALSLSAEVVPEAAAQAAGNLGSLISILPEICPFPRQGNMRARPHLPLTGLAVG